MEFNINDKLPEMSYKLFSEIDPEKNLESLQCPVCYQYYLPVSPKRPAICCQNKHIACEKCICNLIKQKRVQGEAKRVPQQDREPARCMICRAPFLDKIVIDEGKVNLSLQMQKITNRLKEVSQEVKLLILKDCQRRLRRQYQSRLQKLEQRQIEMLHKQDIMKATIQSYIDRQRSLQSQLSKAKAKLQQLQKQNMSQKGKDESILNVASSKKHTESTNPPKRNSPKIVFNHNVLFHEFAFYPYKNQNYWNNFQDKKGQQNSIFRLKKTRLQHIKHQQRKKMVPHKQFFYYNNPQDRLLCFKVRNVNSKVLKYSFGLMDESYEPIKGTSASLYLNLNNSHQPAYQGMQGTIIFFIDLVKKKLYIEAGKAKYEDNIPQSVKIGKFTVYLYFVDNATQYELCDIQNK